jgi:hypothetical protein
MSSFPTIEADYPVRIGDRWQGYFEVNTVDEALVETPVDVTTHEWIITFKDGEETIFTMSTENGYLTLSDTNRVNYLLPAVDTAQFTPRNILGQLRNITTENTIFEVRSQVVPSTNPNG